LVASEATVSEHETFGWRQLLSSVNLRDFADMVRGERMLIWSSLRQGVVALPRLPFGPLVFLGHLLLVMLRSVLLVIVVVVFGTGIALISAVRSVMRRSA
jgi:hypothetical protein